MQISIPNEQTNSDEIVVEGKKEGVKKAVEEIRAIVSKIVSACAFLRWRTQCRRFLYNI